MQTYMAERQHQRIKRKNKELSQQKSVDEFVNVANVEEFVKPERVTKRLARMGICSRRMAERLIEQGMIKVDGQVIT